MNKERLEKLAEHLEKGQLGHKEFNFDKYNYDATAEYPCGTQGCAIGECPILFPEDWYFNPNKSFLPTLKREDFGINDSVTQFFEITNEEEDLLFLPGESTNKLKGDTYIINDIVFEYHNYRATKEEVAQQIRDFIKAKEKDK